MTDPADLTIVEAGHRFRERSLSPVELTQALLNRINKFDGTYHAFLRVTAENALAEAHKAEKNFDVGVVHGPLHGIPYAVKDLIDVDGYPTSCHSKLRAGHIASSDAFVIERLQTAGAVLLGKLALHEFGRGGAMWDLPWPPARNPWDPCRHPGGSSSGSAAAVAARLVPAAIGTDTGGSIRHPATACG